MLYSCCCCAVVVGAGSFLIGVDLYARRGKTGGGVVGSYLFSLHHTHTHSRSNGGIEKG